MAEEKLVKTEWVYAGRRLDPTGKGLYDIYHSLTDKGVVDDKVRPFAAARARRLVGGVYKVETTPDGTRAHLKDALYDRPLKDNALVAGWRLQSDAAEAVVTARKQEKKAKDDMLECLDPLRAAYRRARSYDEQVAMEMMILRYIRSGVFRSGA